MDNKLQELNTEISNLEKEIADIVVELSPLQTKLFKKRELLSDLVEERDRNLYKNRNPEEIDIELVLDGNPRSTAKHREQSRQLQRLGLVGGGYYPETGQTAITVRLTKNKDEFTEKAYKGLCILLPHLKPYQKDSKSIRINIFEHTLSKHTSYSLHILGNFPDAKCEIRTFNRFVQQSFNNLKDALDYIQKNLYYQKS